ncbi:terminus macrodomain insulation protein YfbV [Gallibacterium salpingitidis]|uniref:terminus macrodomain insulation protein YfbV n=1 Tax=Gallibacterium salpingitidis TaxID=505341 RepID=UPI000A614067|nr:terminus macrodomain insulation protein YfbV [Gallibacterium salpingitidis]WKT00668.1 DUF412 family protein [Gallibacterium salpingitidis]
MIFSTINQGVAYATAWQKLNKLKKLNMIFPEPRIIKATRFSQQLLMPLLLFTLGWQYFVLGYSITSFASTLLTILFICSLPLQGFYWLGKRAKKPLSGATLAWYDKIYQQVRLKEALPPIPDTVTFSDLISLLQRAEKHLDPEFWEEI